MQYRRRTPSMMGNLIAWYRFGLGITLAGQGINAWLDASGNGNDLVQATDGARPTKQADGSILFNGTDEFLKAVAFTIVQPLTVYCLFRMKTWSVSDHIWDGDLANDCRMRCTTETPKLFSYAGENLELTPACVVDEYAAVCVVFNGASSVMQKNNETPVTGDLGTTRDLDGFTLASAGSGAAGFGNNEYKEAAIFNVAHHAGQRQEMMRHLATVGGLQI